MPTALETERREIVATVREFVEKDVVPVASELEHADEYPTELVAQMKEMGLFGVTIPEEYGGLGLDLTTYALIQVELSRGWMSLSGVLNTHFISAWMIKTYGTDEQRETYLPRMATGELHSAYSMTEPHAGSDVQAIRTLAERDGDEFVITGQKMWATNGFQSNMMTLLAKTDPNAEPRHRGMTAFVLEKEPATHEQPGLVIPPKLKKLGYKGVESVELVFDGFRDPGVERARRRGRDRRGLQVLHGRHRARPGQHRRAGDRDRHGGLRGVDPLRAGARGIREADREPPGDPAEARPDGDEDRGLAPADDAGGEKKDSGERADLESGMAKLFATETAEEVALEAMRIHGGYGYSTEFLVERLYRDAPVLILGEGSNEIQQLVIARRLLEQYAL